MVDLILWGTVIVIMVIAELSTFQLVSIWFAVGALGAFLVALLSPITLIWQFVIFTFISLILLILTRPFLKKIADKTIPTNAELDIGKNAVIIEEVNNSKGTGRATLNGVNWIAVSSNNEIIPKDSIVKIDEIQGAKLIVSLVNQKQEA